MPEVLRVSYLNVILSTWQQEPSDLCSTWWTGGQKTAWPSASKLQGIVIIFFSKTPDFCRLQVFSAITVWLAGWKCIDVGFDQLFLKGFQRAFSTLLLACSALKNASPAFHKSACPLLSSTWFCLNLAWSAWQPLCILFCHGTELNIL